MKALSNSQSIMSNLFVHSSMKEKLHPDSFILSKLVVQMTGKKTLFDLHREFIASAKAWDSKSVVEYFNKKSRKRHLNQGDFQQRQRKSDMADVNLANNAKSISQEQHEELMNARFTHAIHDLMAIGLIDVKTNRPGVDSTVSIVRCAFALTD